MNLERGLSLLKTCVEGKDSEAQLLFSTLQARLLANTEEDRRYGTTEVIRAERARIVAELNRLSIAAGCGRTFNDMCQATDEAGEVSLPAQARIEAKLDLLLGGQADMKQGLLAVYNCVSADDRSILTSILAVVEEGRLEQGEVTEMIQSLRQWAIHVQETDPPVDDSLTVAVASMAQSVEDKGGMYQYLEVCLPLIPGILSYKVQLGSSHRVNLRKLWTELKQRLGT